MSWSSTVLYYQVINRTVSKQLGGLHSANVLLYSVDFHEIEALQRAGDWKEAGRVLAEAARRLEGAGADMLVLCTNTMHRVAPTIEAQTQIPLLHIADATAAELHQHGVETIGLIGTKFTMQQDFYRGRLERHGLTVRVPSAADQETVHRIIYEELCLGNVRTTSRQSYRHIIDRLVGDGAEGVILGCTEISLLIGSADASVRLYDTTRVHARRAALEALALDEPANPL